MRLIGEDVGNRGMYISVAIRQKGLTSSPAFPPCSSHPYIFFNQDGTSITFVGFMVTQNGDLIDPAHRGILEAAIVTKQLYTGLKQNRVNFDEDYRHWKKDTMIEKVGTVMGLEFIYDPDPTYVLTVDNLIKILAIQMRFRYVCVCACMRVCVCAWYSMCL